ncbi:MAG: translation initiation factor IF-3 [Flammeovirgaceae bacterium]
MSDSQHRINQKIKVKQVRLVGENVQQGIYGRDEALKLAQDLGLDLVEISPNANPPVCKIIDYSKFRYEQKKKQKEMKSKQQKTVTKEIRFGPNTDDHDLNFKTKHAINFLQEGNKVKAYVQFFGRSIVYKDQGFEMLKKLAKGVEEVGKIEMEPKMEGRKLFMILAPKNYKRTVVEEEDSDEA